MGGPRGLSRGAKPWERPASRAEIVGGKSFYAIDGLAISIHRRGEAVEVIRCQSAGELNRHRLQLSEAGLIGHQQGAR